MKGFIIHLDRVNPISTFIRVDDDNGAWIGQGDNAQGLMLGMILGNRRSLLAWYGCSTGHDSERLDKQRTEAVFAQTRGDNMDVISSAVFEELKVVDFEMSRCLS